MIRLVFLILLALALPLPAAAQPIPGAGAPAFVEARDQWLAGEDLPALQALAGLAREGNTAAQMLLSQIATATWTHAHVTEGMERRERIALLRQEGGLSGRDWMQAAAAADEGVAILWAVRRGDSDALPVGSVLRSVLPRGERRAAYDYLARRLETGRVANLSQETQEYIRWLGLPGQHLFALILNEQAQRGLEAWIPLDVRTRQQFVAHLGTLSTRQSQIEAEGLGPRLWQRGGLTYAAPAQTLTGEPSLRSMERDPGLDVLLQSAIATASDLQPLAGACASLCPQGPALCQVTAFRALTDPASAFPYPFASPSPSLVSDSDYQRSPRFTGDLRRRLEGAGWPGCEG